MQLVKKEARVQCTSLSSLVKSETRSFFSDEGREGLSVLWGPRGLWSQPPLGEDKHTSRSVVSCKLEFCSPSSCFACVVPRAGRAVGTHVCKVKLMPKKDGKTSHHSPMCARGLPEQRVGAGLQRDTHGQKNGAVTGTRCAQGMTSRWSCNRHVGPQQTLL